MKIKGPLMGTILLILTLCLLLGTGTIGYMLLEGYSALDALFMTVITLSTVGFGTLRPLSDPGKLFTLFLILVGVATFSFYLTRFFSFIVERGFMDALERRRMSKKIAHLKGHYVVCGHGRIGSVVVEELQHFGKQMLIIEKNEDKIQKLESEGLFAVHGDAREEIVLRQAGLEKANGLIILLPNDADNLYVILAAREINPDLLTVTRANEPSAEKRLLKAGASKVISPHREGGKRVARMMLNPNITDFIDMATEKENLHLQMAEMILEKESSLVEKRLSDTNLLKKHKTLVVAIKRADGSMTFNPSGDTMIHSGDSLIVLGPALKDGLLARQ